MVSEPSSTPPRCTYELPNDQALIISALDGDGFGVFLDRRCTLFEHEDDVEHRVVLTVLSVPHVLAEVPDEPPSNALSSV